MSPSTSFKSRARRVGKRLGKCALWLVAFVIWAWGLGLLRYYEHWPGWFGVSLAFAACIATIVSLRRLGKRRTAIIVASTIGVAAILFYTTQRPKLDREWAADQDRMPQIKFESGGRFVTIKDVRNFTYRTVEDFDPRWEERRYDLDGIRSVDFMLEILPSVPGMAHTLLTFGFDDGRHVAISVEVRKEDGEIFSPLAGLFRRYELMYVIGDERDLIGLRANIRKDRVFLYPLRGERKHIRQLFVAMLNRAEQLRREPEFYHTLTSTCTTNLVRHFEQLRQAPLDFELRILLPADSDELAWELGLIDFDGTLDEAQQRFLINGRTSMLEDGEAWSRQIRQSD